MDAARWSRRMGSDTTIMFRRGRAELRARLEEIEHAEEEGVRFDFLAAPVRLFGDEKGILREMECIRMQLGRSDESGRPSPVPMPGSEFRMPVDTVVMAIGQSPNPTVQRATPQLVTKRGKVVIERQRQTSMANVFAGGDVVRGGSTVILAMRDGRAAAAAIHNALAATGHCGAGALTRATSTDCRRRPSEGVCATERGQSDPGQAAGHTGDCLAASGSPGNRQAMEGRPVRHHPAHGNSERIPLTLVDGDAAAGRITLVVQALGKTSRDTVRLEEGDQLADLLGPLGRPASIEKVGHVLCVAGGVGMAELLPVARAFREAGNRVMAFCGARSTAQIILDEELRAAADEVFWATDDGSAGLHGTVVDLMRGWRADNPGALGRGARYRADSHDARVRRGHPRVGSPDLCQPEPHHGGWHRHVRRVQGHRGRKGQVRLR